MIRNYCGFCENCKKEKNIKDFSLEAKKIISAVGRTKESLGISTLSNMLMGKADTKMLNKGLDKNFYLGIMREDKTRMDRILYKLHDFRKIPNTECRKLSCSKIR